jgi:hypothetical protein
MVLVDITLDRYANDVYTKGAEYLWCKLEHWKEHMDWNFYKSHRFIQWQRAISYAPENEILDTLADEVSELVQKEFQLPQKIKLDWYQKNWAINQVVYSTLDIYNSVHKTNLQPME